MSRNYYYLVAGLPDLMLDQERKDFSLPSLKEEVRENVHPDDYKLVEFLHLPYDNENFLNYLLKRVLDFSELGSFGKPVFENLDDSIAELPEYMQEFYRNHTGKGIAEEDEENNPVDSPAETAKKHPEVLLQEKFYAIATSHSNRFLREWFTFIRDFSNILTAVNCRRLGKDPINQLVGDGPLVEVLARSQAADFGLRREIDYLDKLLQIIELPGVLDRERKLDLVKWEVADELTVRDYFNINAILAFFVKAGIVYRWKKLDAKIGEELFKRLVDDLKATYSMPSEFVR
jgi:hypothetical protein